MEQQQPQGSDGSQTDVKKGKTEIHLAPKNQRPNDAFSPEDGTFVPKTSSQGIDSSSGHNHSSPSKEIHFSPNRGDGSDEVVVPDDGTFLVRSSHHSQPKSGSHHSAQRPREIDWSPGGTNVQPAPAPPEGTFVARSSHHSTRNSSHSNRKAPQLTEDDFDLLDHLLDSEDDDIFGENKNHVSFHDDNDDDWAPVVQEQAGRSSPTPTIRSS